MLALMYGFGAIMCVIVVTYRYILLKLSKLFEEEKAIERKLGKVSSQRAHLISIWHYIPRLFVGPVGWICNDFDFYGNKLQQNVFLAALFPGATPYLPKQWNCLNSFIALLGYYAAAALCDKAWYGRMRCQTIGFFAMFIFYIVIYGAWSKMGGSGATVDGAKVMQVLYYLSSFFNQFGPNSTTCLVAGEIFPTDVRASYHVFCACMGKLGALIASLWISYISDDRKVFLVSAVWGIGGALVTAIWLPDTTDLCPPGRRV